MKQSDIFVLDKCEITVDKNIYSEHEVDLHNLRKPKSQSQKKSKSALSILPHVPYIQRIEIALLSYSLVHTDNTKH